MKRSPVFLAAAIALFAPDAPCQVDQPLKLIHSIPLPGLHDGNFDHFEVDLPGHRLFLAGENNSVVEVIDTSTNKLIHTIRVPYTPHSMAYETELNLI